MDDLNKVPRITKQHIDSMIEEAETQYYVFPGTQHTVCCIKLANNHTLVGDSACVSPENYNKVVGRKIAKDRAVDKLWGLEGYLLRVVMNECQDICDNG